MGIYIIIQKTYNESNRITGSFKDINILFPDDFPMVVSEKVYKSANDARNDNPGKVIIPIQEYKTQNIDRKVLHRDLLELKRLKHEEVQLLQEISETR